LPFYVNAQALLSDIRLRLDALGDESAVLVVEGNDDKRLFFARISSTSDIVPAGGKTLLRAALDSIRDVDKGRILFFTDCDYDVSSGELHGGPDVVITTSCDVESDLISLGLLGKVAIEVVPQAVIARDSPARIEVNIREHAERLALPFGRIRMAAQPFGVDLQLDDIDFAKYWDKKTNKVLVEKIYQVMWDHLSGEVDVNRQDWDARLQEIPENSMLCHGKDLVKAAQMFFRYLYKMDSTINKDVLAMMLRLVVDQEVFENWTVVKRMRKWEDLYGRSILSPSR
jgi:hypothetical protein